MVIIFQKLKFLIKNDDNNSVNLIFNIDLGEKAKN